MNGPQHKRYLSEAVGNIPSGNDPVSVAWRSPSNIALVKYWGKIPGQFPKNPSLSFTLREAVSEMELIARPHKKGRFELEYLFEGRENREFESRIRKFIESILPFFPFMDGYSLKINSRNTFPHSSGIASSASSMSALALCLCSLEEKILGRRTEEDFYRKASFMARLASGSASRSVYGGFVTWGKSGDKDGSSDEFATPLATGPGHVFRELYDAVLLVSSAKKKVSSSQGHALMDTHPFADERYRLASGNLKELRHALHNNDVDSFIRICENEALGLHGLMMSSDPGFLLLEPGSLEIIKRVRNFREETGVFLTFTIDAGPNIHLIYPVEERERIKGFIENELLEFCQDGKWIDDGIGDGPTELST